MPNGLQMWPNVITGPLCVNTQRALKCINPTDVFSSPSTPASNQITHKGSSSISLAPQRTGEPCLVIHEKLHTQNQSIVPQTQRSLPKTHWRWPLIVKASLLGYWKWNHHRGSNTKESDRTLAWYQAVSKPQSCYPFERVVTLQATNTVTTYTEASKRAIMCLNIYDKTMRKVFISYKTMRIFCFNLNR